jgi:predicted TIM-barrel fold metal-dependent hydrolase
MLDDMFVVDAVVHPLNLSAENQIEDRGSKLVDGLYDALHQWNPREERIPRALFETDQTPEIITNTMFRETSVDLAVNHALPLYSWLKDGGVSPARNVEIMQKYPDRWLVYATADPLDGRDSALEALDAQAADLPNQLTGLKFYPSRPHMTKPGQDEYYRLDDEGLMFPIYERCLELGIKSVATHKSTPLGVAPLTAFAPGDVDIAAGTFPELNFEIVHGGMAFVEELCQSLARYPNVYANLETTFMYIFAAPGLFEDVLGRFAHWAGYDRLLFSSGMSYSHPELQLKLFKEFQYSEHVMEKYGLAQITDEDKAKILGLNFAQMVDLDIDAAKAKIQDDEFSRHQREHGMDAPWSNWRAADPENAAQPLPEKNAFGHRTTRMPSAAI